jgi:hypothetical protein
VKLFLGILLGLLLNKAAWSAHWYTFFYYEKQCRDVRPHSESMGCVVKKQGIFHYLGIASGTLTYDPIDGYQWRY